MNAEPAEAVPLHQDDAGQPFPMSWLASAQWPVGADIAAVPQARRRLAEHIESQCLPLSRDSVQDALLCFTEVLTNAVVHTGAPCQVRVSWRAEHLRVAVVDSSLRLPEPPDGDRESTGGRGLHLVAALAKGWGWEPVGVGKAVWFEIAQDQALPGDQRFPLLVRRAHHLAATASEAPPSHPPRRRNGVAPQTPTDAAPPLAQRAPGMAWAAFASA